MSKKSKSVKRKSKKKLKTFLVPITVHISGEEEVKAATWQQAIKKAKEQYFKRDHNNYCHGVDTPCVDIDIAECEEDVEEI